MVFTALEMLCSFCLYYRLDISQYNTAQYCTRYNIFECETSARLWAHKRHPYLALTGKLWVFFVSYSEKSDHEISGMYCIISSIFFSPPTSCPKPLSIKQAQSQPAHLGEDHLQGTVYDEIYIISMIPLGFILLVPDKDGDDSDYNQLILSY